jgi:putative DeoR family transcriptional regulator (stage III sporulation protein D)
LKGYIEERAVEIANYIIDNNATVRQTAKQFGISKSTVHKAVTKVNEIIRKGEISWRIQRMIRTLW